jgi:hypothetical protein
MSVLVAEQALAALVDLRATSAVRRIDLGREESHVFPEGYSVAHKDSLDILFVWVVRRLRSCDDADRCVKREEFVTELFEQLSRDGGMLLGVIAVVVRAVGLLGLVCHCGDAILDLLGRRRREVVCELWYGEKVELASVVVARRQSTSSKARQTCEASTTSAAAYKRK